MPELLAALAATVWGAGDYLGSVFSRKIPSVRISIFGNLISGTLWIPFAILVGGSPRVVDIVAPAIGGILGTLAMVLFLYLMAQYKMSVISPVTAVVSAIVPCVGAVVIGDSPEAIAWVGIVVALPAIALIASGHEIPTARNSNEHILRALLLAALAGAGFGAFAILFNMSRSEAGIWPVVATFFVPGLMTVFLLPSFKKTPVKGQLRQIATFGILMCTGDTLYLYVLHGGNLAVVSVIGAMYPVVVLAFAHVREHERFTRPQAWGLALTPVALALISVGS